MWGSVAQVGGGWEHLPPEDPLQQPPFRGVRGGTSVQVRREASTGPKHIQLLETLSLYHLWAQQWRETPEPGHSLQLMGSGSGPRHFQLMGIISPEYPNSHPTSQSWPISPYPLVQAPSTLATPPQCSHPSAPGCSQHLALPWDGDGAGGELGVEIIVRVIQVDTLDRGELLNVQHILAVHGPGLQGGMVIPAQSRPIPGTVTLPNL